MSPDKLVISELAPLAAAPKAALAKGAVIAPVPPLAIGKVPDTSAVKLTADHEGLPDAFPCKSVVVVPWLAKSAEARAGLLNEGAAVDPVKLPKNVWAPAVERVNDNAGVVEAVATDVVNSGLNVPAEKVVTVPEAAATHEGASVVPLLCKTCPAVPLANMAVVPAAD